MTTIEKLCRKRIASLRLAVSQKRIILPIAQREVKALMALILASQADQIAKIELEKQTFLDAVK